jgi:hypothetical protein
MSGRVVSDIQVKVYVNQHESVSHIQIRHAYDFSLCFLHELLMSFLSMITKSLVLKHLVIYILTLEIIIYFLPMITKQSHGREHATVFANYSGPLMIAFIYFIYLFKKFYPKAGVTIRGHEALY